MLFRIMENTIVAVPKIKDTKNKMLMNFRILRSFINPMIFGLNLDFDVDMEARPMIKAVQVAISMVEATRSEDVNTTGLLTLIIISPNT